MLDPVLDVRNLNVAFQTPEGDVCAVNDVSFNVQPGERVGIVGESGSGKSQIFMAVMGLLATNGRASGAVKFQGQDILNLPVRELNRIRGSAMTMIFQDPMTSLTPHMKVGDQLAEVLGVKQGLKGREAREQVLAMLDKVRIPEASRRYDQYPHELSGGMRQRIMIAMALLCSPGLLIADEPTTALDVTVQAQVLNLFKALESDFNTSLIMITHDLGVVAGLCDRVFVMYGGRIVEAGPVDDIFYRPRHPYTEGLLKSMPRLDGATGGKLPTIAGQPPNLQNLPDGCAYNERCGYTVDACFTDRPVLREMAPGCLKACHRDDLELGT